MIIDAHHHLWNPARGDYDWMPMDNPTLARAYAPGDYPIEEIDKTVLVQAATTVEETEYMLGLADATSWIAGVVGWVNFEDEDQIATLMRLAAHPKFLGVRPMIQDIADDDWMLRDDVQWAFSALVDLDLCFDALGFPRHLTNFNTILSRYPGLRTVVDHCMKPNIAQHNAAAFDDWARGMAQLAERGAYCKLSGLITEASSDWSISDLRPYAEKVISLFGAERVMWGSDWPVCCLAGSHTSWLQTAQNLTADLSDKDRSAIFYQTASAFYRLEAATA